MPPTGNSAELRRSELHVGSSSTDYPDVTHGTITAYKRHACRCTPCRKAWAYYNKAYQCEFYRGRRRQVPPGAARSILGALWADGWSFPELGRRLDVQAKTVAAIVYGRRTRITVTMQRAVLELADDILGWPGPSGKARTTAKAHGWTPNLSILEIPHVWSEEALLRAEPPHAPTGDNVVDPVVVERLIDGQPPLHITRAERAEAVRVLNARGWSHSLIAQQLAMSGTRVKQILDASVRPERHTPADDNNRQEASA